MSKLHTALIVAGCFSVTCSAVAAQERESAQGLTFDQARMMDADRDGKITEEEFLRESSDRDLFAQLDTNFDGVLDNEEQRLGIRVPVRIVR